VKEVTLTGNQLRASLVMPASAGGMTATMTGTIEGESLRGTISIGEMGAFEFTGTKPKTEGL
jgi:hypothetical protein